MAGAVDLVRRFRRRRALVIGDAMLDSYFEGSATRLCSEGPVPVVRKSAEMHLPGGAANTAANLRAMGAQVAYLALLGDDAAGEILRASLCERGVDDRWLVADPDVSTLHKLRILADDQYMVRFDSGDTRRCSAAGRAHLLASLKELYPWCDLVVISDYRYGLIWDELLARLGELRAARPTVLAVDSKDLARCRSLAATVITPNHLEARLATGGSAAHGGEIDRGEVERLGRRLLDMIDTEYVAVTLAGDGVLVVEREGPVTHIPSHPVAHANDVGAGDSFIAAMALGLAAGGMAVEAARLGVAAGSIAVTQQRTAVVTHQALLQRVSLEDQAAPPPAQALAAALDEARRQGKRVVFTNGVFDILHAGHIHLLRQARSLGDVLVVGVNSDASARRLKGKNRPINSERDRLALVAALDSVDHVVLFDEETPAGLIRTLRPDIHAKGGDYAGETLPEAEAVREVGGRVVIVPLREQLSTSSVIERIVSLALAEGGDGPPGSALRVGPRIGAGS